MTQHGVLGKNKLVGCYEDSSDRVLKGHHVTWDDLLTKERCINLCFRLGFLYAGLENGRECFCGDERPTNRKKFSNNDCNGKCTGNDKSECGRASKIAVFETDIPDETTTGKYIGCFKDDENTRLLDGYKVDLEKTNSPSRCLNICFKLEYQYAGMQYGMECYCGNQRPSSKFDMPDTSCSIPCSGDKAQICGGHRIMSVYRTGKGGGGPDSNNKNKDKDSNSCDLSVTTFNGKRVCRGKHIFKEFFEEPLSEDRWEYTVKIADAPDYEFVTYTEDASNLAVNDGRLKITPSVLRDDEVRNGKIDLGTRCTGKAGTRECYAEALSYIILPPTTSARLTTRKSFSFRYGQINFRAKFPLGDWLVPELWLEPKHNKYGPGYRSGRIRVGTARGNRALICDGIDMGNKRAESGVTVGTDDGLNVKSRTVERTSKDFWRDRFHNYTLIWTPDNLTFLIDGENQQSLIPENAVLSEELGFSKEEAKIWESGSKLAPFDEEFYISVGVSVGGARDFPDTCNSKPWKNFEVKQMLNFWRAKSYWYPTWQTQPTMEMEHIRVVAL